MFALAGLLVIGGRDSGIDTTVEIWSPNEETVCTLPSLERFTLGPTVNWVQGWYPICILVGRGGHSVGTMFSGYSGQRIGWSLNWEGWF